jgi:hypothetical protein
MSKENLVNIRRAIGGLVGAFPKEGFIPKLIGTYWAKGAAIVVCLDKVTRDWLQRNVPVMKAWEGCRLEVFAPYKRVTAWFSGPSEDMECLFLLPFWLKEGLNTGQWRVYERKEELSDGVCLVLSNDLRSAASLERMKWHPFKGVGQATSSLGAKSEERHLEEGLVGDSDKPTT